jgi:hypothetical protein
LSNDPGEKGSAELDAWRSVTCPLPIGTAFRKATSATIVSEASMPV